MKFNRAMPLLLSLLLVLTSLAMASATWYVNGVSGSDSNNCTSPTTACKTIGHAISLAASGDSIHVAAAKYKENLQIAINLTITGVAASKTIIDGGQLYGSTPVTISSGVNVVLSRMKIQNGYSIDGGGIANYGILSINYCTVANNRVLSQSNFASTGGGISNIGTLMINNSTVSGNSASANVSSGKGGGVYNAGEVTISSSSISGNFANGNSYGNTAGLGGGIFNNGGTLIINNSTVSNNGASSPVRYPKGIGGGVYNAGTLVISNSTISTNSAPQAGGVFNSSGWTAAFENSILAYNTVVNKAKGNCSGTVTSNGYNLSSDNTCNFNNTGDLNNTDPGLGPLQNNGGPTKTMALPSGSPAIDAGNPNGCTDGNGNLLKTDQRGKPRPDKEDAGGCDMGAYESQSD